MRKFLGDVGLSDPGGRAGPHPARNDLVAPDGEVNGIWGGYTGDGFKTVLPAEAHAKVSFRLVGQQDPQAICAAFRAFVEDEPARRLLGEFHALSGSPARPHERSTIPPSKRPAPP